MITLWHVQLQTDLKCIVDGCPVIVPIKAGVILEVAPEATPAQAAAFVAAHPEAIRVSNWRECDQAIRVSE